MDNRIIVPKDIVQTDQRLEYYLTDNLQGINIVDTYHSGRAGGGSLEIYLLYSFPRIYIYKYIKFLSDFKCFENYEINVGIS